MIIDTQGNGSNLFQSLDPSDNGLYTYSQSNSGLFVPVNNLVIGNSAVGGNISISANNLSLNANNNNITFSSNAFAQVQTALMIPNCGRFDIYNANNSGASNTVYFYPYKGNVIMVGDQLYQIPVGGIIGNCQNCYVDGVPNQTLSASSGWYAYIFVNGNQLAMEFSAQTHSASTTTGVEVKTNDPSRTLVGSGWVANWGGATPNQWESSSGASLVISWYNRRYKATSTSYSQSGVNTGSAWGATGELVYTLNWQETPYVWVQMYGQIQPLAAGTAAYSGVTFNGGSSGIFVDVDIQNNGGSGYGTPSTHIWYPSTAVRVSEIALIFWELIVLSSAAANYGVSLRVTNLG